MPVRPFCNNEPGSGADDFPEGGPRSISPRGNGGGGGPRFPPGGGGGFIGRPHPPPPPPPGFGAEFHPAAHFGNEPEILNGKLPTSPLMPPHPDGANQQQQQQQFPSNLQVRRIFLITNLLMRSSRPPPREPNGSVL